MPTDLADEAPEPAPRSESDLWLLARHDLRQWSQSLLGLAPAISRTLDPTERKVIQHVVTGLALSFARTIELMALLATDTGRNRAGPPPHTPLVMLAERLDTSHRQLVAAGGASLVIEPLEGTASADPALLEAALSGLLLTAVKLRQSGDIALKSELSEDDVWISVSVHYRGIDPSPGLTRHAFVELPPLPAAPDRPFVGYGIELVAEVARRLGGELRITSERGNGWRMVLEFPAADGQ